ncbi:MAG: PH domain-containing protein [Deltaproteobacteria bacterium]|nr:PH domain-containing protein [Deltaproteobacteria bacterium]
MTLHPVSFSFRPAWSSYFVFYTAAALFILGPSLNPDYAPYRVQGLFVSALILVFVVLRRSTTLYAWKENGFTVNNGIPRGRDEEIPYGNISEVELRRGLTQRMLGIGNVALHLKSPEGRVRVLYGVRNPVQFKERLIQRLDK